MGMLSVILALSMAVTATAAGTQSDDDDDFEAILADSVPTVRITAPTSPYTVQGVSQVNFTVNAVPKKGTITKVELWTTTLLGQATNVGGGNWTFAWTPPATGVYNVVAKVFTTAAPPSDTATSTAVRLAFNTPPTISLVANKALAAPRDALTLTATAADPDAGDSITKVEYYQNGALIGTQTTTPFAWSLSAPTPGTAPTVYAYTAKAYDSNGGITTSAAANVTIAFAPTLALTSPVACAAFAGPASVSLVATASTTNAGGSIARVEFYNGAALLGQVTTQPSTYTFAWNSVANGSYSITAKAIDNLGLTTTTAVRTVAVSGAPTFSSFTVTPATVNIPGTVTLDATATSGTACGSLKRVEFWNGTTLLNSDTTAPYQYPNWPPAAPGTYTVFARAYDQLDRFTDSTSQQVVVTNLLLPTISALTPVKQQIVLGGSAAYTLVATNPNSGHTTTVTLMRGAVTLATGVNLGGNNWRITYTPGAAVTDDPLKVEVKDVEGNVKVSNDVTLTVIAAPTSAAPNPDSVVEAYSTPAVGTLAGTFGVADNGAASYVIPIQVPPGPNGMQPSLSLMYNSQGGNGQLGVGWTLGGLSAITRCPRTMSQDGTRSPINYDVDITNDRFCLDGQRLVPVSGPVAVTDQNYGNGGTAAYKYEYRTEIDGFSRIESYQDQIPNVSYGPYRWRVYTKAGQIYDYSSRFLIVTAGNFQDLPNNGSEVHRGNVEKVWPLDRVIDPSGNFMEIDYTGWRDTALLNVYNIPPNCGGGGIVPASAGTPIGAYPNVEFSPTAIRYYSSGSYLSGCGSSPSHQVRFTYEDIPSQVADATRDRYYDQGAGQTSISKRLTTIQTSIDGVWPAQGTLVKQYKLSYGNSFGTDVPSAQSGRSLLRKVEECTGDGSACLPPTVFDWAANDATTGWVATGHNFAGGAIAALPFFVSKTGQTDNDVYVVDWNGDGKSDLLGWQRATQGDGSVLSKLFVCLSTGAGFSCGANPIAQYTSSDPVITAEFADLNNDGKADLFYVSGNGFKTCLSDGQYGCSTGTITTGGVTPNGPSFRGDMDGDGTIDIVHYLGNGKFLTCLTQSGICYTNDLSPLGTAYSACPSGFPNCESFEGADAQYEVMIADVNGDGRADLIRRRAVSTSNTVDYYPNASPAVTIPWNEQWKVCLADFGTGRSNNYICHDRFVWGPGASTADTVVLDFNGDGLADVASTEGTNTWRVCLSTGDGAFEFRNINVHWDTATSKYVRNNGTPVDYYVEKRCRLWTGPGSTSNAKTIFGDFNADGRSDAASWDSANNNWKVCLSTGSDFSCSNWSGPVIQNAGNNNPDLNQWMVTGDFNGDGKTDVMFWDYYGNPSLYIASGPPQGDVITRITTGLGAVTQVTYAPLTDSTVYSKAGTALGTSELDLQSPMYVVSKTEASTTLASPNQWFTNTYFYENLRGRVDGRGLYGFAKRRVRDGNGVVSETEYVRVASASFGTSWPVVGRPYYLRKYAPTPASYVADISNAAAFNGGTSLFGGNLKLINRVRTDWAVANSSTCGTGTACGGSPAIKLLQAETVVEENFELDGSALPSTTTSMTLANQDVWGNQKVVTTTSSDGFTKTTTSTYLNDTTTWVLGRIATAQVVSTDPYGQSGTRTSKFTYHGFGGATCTGGHAGYLCSEEVEPGTKGVSPYSLWQQTSYTYDAFGNRISATTQFYQRDGTLTTRTTSTVYESTGRFPATVTNAVGQSETRTYDRAFGGLLTLVGPNGITSESVYDAFGRKYIERSKNTAGTKFAETFIAVETTGISGAEKYRQRARVAGGGEVSVYFDSLQREVRRTGKKFDGGLTTTTLAYNAFGQKVQSARPAGGYTQTTTTTYDVLNRPLTESTQGDVLTLINSYQYQAFASLPQPNCQAQAVGGGQSVLVTQAAAGSTAGTTSRVTTKTTNSQGQTIRVTDGEGGVTDHCYDGYGNLRKTIDPAGKTETLSYDVRGRKLSLTSPDSGAWNYDYNGAGELVQQTDAKSQVSTLFYDALGRMIERREYPGNTGTTPFVTAWSYDKYAGEAGAGTCSRGNGKLCEVRTQTVARSDTTSVLGNPETRKVVSYDTAGRTTQSTDSVDGRSYTSVMTFDANGRVDKRMFPTGYALANRYTTTNGELDQVTEWPSGTVHWQATARYPDGQLSTMNVGGIVTAKDYDGFGRIKAHTTTGIQNANYTYDLLGNLLSRVDAIAGPTTQTFSYDRVNRLTTTPGELLTYGADGNIATRGAQTYTYIAATHRVQSAKGYGYSYDANGAVTQITGGAATRTIMPNQFGLPTSIVAGSSNLAYLYDGTHGRIREVSVTPAGTATTYYLGGFEEHVTSANVTEWRHYIATPEGTIGVVTLRSNSANDTRYWHKDHLGSVVAISDAAGVLKQRFAYDAWGARAQNFTTGEPYEERGYTGHEELPEVGGIVHMNGRLYDQNIGRMLSADPVVQDPFNGQSLNRYSYVLNNPLAFTDPSGYSAWTTWRRPIAAIAVTVAAWYAAPFVAAEMAEVAFVQLGEMATLSAYNAGYAATIMAGGFAAGGIQGGNIESAVTGAIAAGLNYGIGEFTGHAPMFGTNEFAQNVALHAALGCAQQAGAGGSCGGGAAAAGFSALLGPIPAVQATGLAGRIAVGAIASRLAGGKAGDGAVTAAFEYLFNEVGSLAQRGYLSTYVQDRLNVLKTWVDKLADPEVSAAMQSSFFTESNEDSSSYGRIRYAAASGRTITIYRNFFGLPVSDKYSVLAHELSHLTETNLAMDARLSSGDRSFRTTPLIDLETQANTTAMRILYVGRGTTQMPEILRNAQQP